MAGSGRPGTGTLARFSRGRRGRTFECVQLCNKQSEEEAPDADAAISLHRFLLLLITLVRMALLHLLRSVEC